MPKLDEVRERVREDVVREKARELARQKAQSVAASLKTRAGLRQGRARPQDSRSKSTELIARDSAAARHRDQPGRGSASPLPCRRTP